MSFSVRGVMDVYYEGKVTLPRRPIPRVPSKFLSRDSIRVSFALFRLLLRLLVSTIPFFILRLSGLVGDSRSPYSR